jgi:hypothetical protein
MIRDVIDALGRIVVTRRIRIGDVVAENVCGSGVNIVCTSEPPRECLLSAVEPLSLSFIVLQFEKSESIFPAL